jgi:hypothetical protein
MNIDLLNEAIGVQGTDQSDCTYVNFTIEADMKPEYRAYKSDLEL